MWETFVYVNVLSACFPIVKLISTTRGSVVVQGPSPLPHRARLAIIEQRGFTSGLLGSRSVEEWRAGKPELQMPDAQSKEEAIPEQSSGSLPFPGSASVSTSIVGPKEPQGLCCKELELK